jgi:hypothetical protein
MKTADNVELVAHITVNVVPNVALPDVQAILAAADDYRTSREPGRVLTQEELDAASATAAARREAFGWDKDEPGRDQTLEEAARLVHDACEHDNGLGGHALRRPCEIAARIRALKSRPLPPPREPGKCATCGGTGKCACETCKKNGWTNGLCGDCAGTGRLPSNPGDSAILFITGQHPTCPACESLVLPDGKCVNGCAPRQCRPWCGKGADARGVHPCSPAGEVQLCRAALGENTCWCSEACAAAGHSLHPPSPKTCARCPDCSSPSHGGGR